MFLEDLSQTRLSLPQLLLELLVKLFTLGIFSVEGGAKAWFELILVVAALCASGYIIWWQIPLLILAIIFGTAAAGMFSLLAPRYMNIKNYTANNQIASTLNIISKYNLNEILTLSEEQLNQRLKQIQKAQQILKANIKIVKQLSELQNSLNNINETHDIAFATVEHQKQVKYDKQHKEAEQRRKDWEFKQEKIKKEAELIAKQEQLFAKQRREAQFTGGCPPDSNSRGGCRSGYPIKVTIDKKEDGFDGIIWKPSDKKYKEITPQWCYRSVEEAESERGKYRFRRPKNSKGERIP